MLILSQGHLSTRCWHWVKPEADVETDRAAVEATELMVAAHLRKRVDTVAWTPGLVLDNTRALPETLEPSRKREGSCRDLP
jgi:hypothetical protein